MPEPVSGSGEGFEPKTATSLQGVPSDTETQRLPFYTVFALWLLLGGGLAVLLLPLLSSLQRTLQQTTGPEVPVAVPPEVTAPHTPASRQPLAGVQPALADEPQQSETAQPPFEAESEPPRQSPRPQQEEQPPAAPAPRPQTARRAPVEARQPPPAATPQTAPSRSPRARKQPPPQRPPQEPSPAKRPAQPARNAATGTLAVNTHPWAWVYIDGRKIGTTPLETQLAPGTYEVRLVRDGLADVVRKIVIKAHAEVRLN